MVGSEHSIDVSVNSDKVMTDNDDDDDEQSEALNEFNCDMNNHSSVTSTLYPMNDGTHYFECLYFYKKINLSQYRTDRDN